MAASPNMFQRFLSVIRRVPRGKVVTYGDVAYAAGYPGYARQVAWALHAGHPDVPWQRVVGSGGKILLTGEFAMEQRFRLEAEGVRFIGLRIDMRAHQHSFFKASKGNSTVARNKKKDRQPASETGARKAGTKAAKRR